jgi:hypothetical protein
MLLQLFCETCKCRGVIFCECRKRFTVKSDVFLFQFADEFGIRKARRAARRIDAQRPQVAVLTLLGSSVSECRCSGVSDCLPCHALLCGASEPVTFHLRKYVPAPLHFCYTSFDSGHVKVVIMLNNEIDFLVSFPMNWGVCDATALPLFAWR